MSGTGLYSGQWISTSLKPFRLWSSIKVQIPKYSKQPIFQTESIREMYFSCIPLHAAVSISYAAPSKLQYITYDTFMTPWSNRHIYTRKRGDESYAKISFLSNKHKSLHYSIWANLCYHALYRSSTCIIRPTQSTLLISCYLCY